MAAELQATLAQLQQSFSATGDSRAVRLQADPVLQAAAAIHKWLDSIDHPGCKRLRDDEPSLAVRSTVLHLRVHPLPALSLPMLHTSIPPIYMSCSLAQMEI